MLNQFICCFKNTVFYQRVTALHKNEIWHNASVVVKRNIGGIRKYLIFTVIAIFIISFGEWMPGQYTFFLYSVIRLGWSLFEFVLDFLDSVLANQQVSSFRKRYFDNKIVRIKNSRKDSKKIILPFRTTHLSQMPQVIIVDSKVK